MAHRIHGGRGGHQGPFGPIKIVAGRVRADQTGGIMAFSGWPEEALDFYDGLAADNSKTYWTEHKAVYEDKILRPMAELTEELAAEFGEPKIFRPYRDVR